jgi:PAS domain S-box-containing protein
MLLNARQIQRVLGKERIILLAIEDITERRRLEDLLTESEERYRRLFETANDGILLLEKHEGKITHANPASTEMLGYSKEECIGKKLQNIGVSLDMGDFQKIMQTLDKSGIIYYDDVPVKTKAGQYIDTDIYMVDRARLVQCNIRDITERKKAEESLREALKEVKQLKNQLREENLYLREEINLIHSHKDIVGNSEAISTVLKQIEQVAPTDSTVLIQGETGTGKELLAHAIHNLSARKGRLMIKVNCGALPPTLIESELFGREKGAFTGALSKQLGRFELADASTIFLDEIDALPLELQAKLLRVLESGEFERLGSPRTVKVDTRIISATNRDLARLVSEGGFREDLYYRLNVFQITVPPLRERREDILPLVWSFVQEFSKRMGKRIESIPQKGVEALQAYPWPGNVRELRNVTERAMIITTGLMLHLDIPMIAQSGADQSGTLEEVEKRHIIEALNTTGWRVSGKNGAAEILGINPKTLESRMQRLGIQRNKKNA